MDGKEYFKSVFWVFSGRPPAILKKMLMNICYKTPFEYLVFEYLLELLSWSLPAVVFWCERPHVVGGQAPYIVSETLQNDGISFQPMETLGTDG
jgi:hypothetical protein